MQEHSFRRTLSEKLHVGTCHDFDEAIYFIHFVYLIGNDNRKQLADIKDFLTAAILPIMIFDDRFCMHDMASYALQI